MLGATFNRFGIMPLYKPLTPSCWIMVEKALKVEVYANLSDSNPFICVLLLTTSNGYVTIRTVVMAMIPEHNDLLDCAVAPATAPQPNRNGTDSCVSCEWNKK